MPEAAVKALIEEDGRFLALQTDADGGEPRWGLPGGRVEHGESPHEALRREVQEEVSLDVAIHGPVGVFHFTWQDTQIVPTVFRCTRTGGDPDVGDGVDGDQILMAVEWVSPAAFLERRAEDGLKRVIRDRYGVA